MLTTRQTFSYSRMTAQLICDSHRSALGCRTRRRTGMMRLGQASHYKVASKKDGIEHSVLDATESCRLAQALENVAVVGYFPRETDFGCVNVQVSTETLGARVIQGIFRVARTDANQWITGRDRLCVIQVYTIVIDEGDDDGFGR